MVKVSIISLIYCSSKYADWIHDSVHRFTPMLATGEAEFFFIANDPTEDLLKHLREKKFLFIELFAHELHAGDQAGINDLLRVQFFGQRLLNQFFDRLGIALDNRVPDILITG